MRAFGWCLVLIFFVGAMVDFILMDCFMFEGFIPILSQLQELCAISFGEQKVQKN